MRNFLHLGRVDPIPLLANLAAHPELWDQNTLRTTYPGTAHHAVSDIWLFFNDTSDPEAVVNDKEVVAYPAWSALPQARTIIFDLMRRVEGHRLGRVLITRLPPGKSIDPHTDGGAPATYFNRYQIALQSLPGVLFRAGDEAVNMTSGDCWYFDNTKQHTVVNNSADDRIAMIVDIRCD